MTIDPTSIVKWFGGLVAAVHKEAAIVIAVLASFGVTPGTASTHKIEAAIFAGYAALTHLAESVSAKKAAPAATPPAG